MARIAVVGSGIAGLGCAHLLDGRHEVTLFEADGRLGGHTNTVMVDDPAVGQVPVDTGFIVHNDRNYPNLLRLFDRLGVVTQDSEMSFSVSEAASGFTYRATNLRTLLARPRNAIDPRLWRMVADIIRFYRAGNRFLDQPDQTKTIGEFLDEGRYSAPFTRLHLLPMGAAVWSTSPEHFSRFPATTLLTFLRNHGLLGIGDRPQWRTVVGGSRAYVDAIVDRFAGEIRRGCPANEVRRIRDDRGETQVQVISDAGTERFDHVILACHSDQARELLGDRTMAEDQILGAIRYDKSDAVLHTDTSVLPSARRAWAAWNYHVGDDASKPTLTYDMTRLQRLPGDRRYLVTLNPEHELDNVIGRYRYAHPQFDMAAVAAQARVEEIDGHNGVFFCGAYWGYGFHEDGLSSAVRVCRKLGVTW